MRVKICRLGYGAAHSLREEEYTADLPMISEWKMPPCPL